MVESLFRVPLSINSLARVKHAQAEGSVTKVVVPSLTETKQRTRYRDGKVVTTTGAKVIIECHADHGSPHAYACQFTVYSIWDT